MENTKTYDRFPLNELEMQGSIDRKSFHFIAYNCKVWHQGSCIADLDSIFEIDAEVNPFNGAIDVRLDNSEIEEFIDNYLTFTEISQLNDRILWSNNLLGGGVGFRYRDMSLFYSNGILSKIYLNRRNPWIMLEFNASEEEHRTDVEAFLEQIIPAGRVTPAIDLNPGFYDAMRKQNPGSDYSGKQSDYSGITQDGKFDFKYYAHLLTPKHTKLINFFQEHTLGSNMPIMTYFSILEPIDRVVVLEQLFSPYTLNSNLQDKLCLGYLKIGNVDLAKRVYESSMQKGENKVNIWRLQQKFVIGIPNKVSDSQRLQKLRDWRYSENGLLEKQFIDMLVEFINENNNPLQVNIFPAEAQGVVINGVTWATCNVDEPGTFASSPESAGKFYQWNRKKAWPATGSVSNWDSSLPSGDTWAKENDPSPSGWRVPTIAEMEKLFDENRVTNERTEVNGVNGRKFTDKATGASIFLPAAGSRNYDGGSLYDVGYFGYYWSSTGGDSVNAYGLGFYSVNAGLDDDYRRGGLSVRPVAE
jgi:uncharacterized protein (TIGR02145 family)